MASSRKNGSSNVGASPSDVSIEVCRSASLSSDAITELTSLKSRVDEIEAAVIDPESYSRVRRRSMAVALYAYGTSCCLCGAAVMAVLFVYMFYFLFG